MSNERTFLLTKNGHTNKKQYSLIIKNHVSVSIATTKARKALVSHKLIKLSIQRELHSKMILNIQHHFERESKWRKNHMQPKYQPVRAPLRAL